MHRADHGGRGERGADLRAAAEVERETREALGRLVAMPTELPPDWNRKTPPLSETLPSLIGLWFGRLKLWLKRVLKL
jgi:hypothetical protein